MTLQLLIGMIGSGKSTYARKRADEGALCVTHDDLVSMLHTRHRYQQDLRGVYRAMEEAIVWQAIMAGLDIVVDRTHLTRESRARWVDYAKSFITRPKVIAVAFPIESPEVHARRRFDSDPRGRSYKEWLTVARLHHGQATVEPLEWEAEDFDGYRLETTH